MIDLIQSISDLRNYNTSTLTTGDVILLVGYNFFGDGGGGQFNWDNSSTETDNDFNIISPTYSGFGGIGRWNRVRTNFRQSLKERGVKPYNELVSSLTALNGMFPSNLGDRHWGVDGRYYIPTDEFVITKFQNSSIVGKSVGTSNNLRPLENTGGVLLYIGDDTEAVAGARSVIEKITLDLRHDNSVDTYKRVAGITGLFLRHQNIIDIENLNIIHVGEGAIGVETKEGDTLMQEIFFRRLEIDAGEPGGHASGSYGVKMYPTGNIEFDQCNIESVQNAFYLRFSRRGKLSIDQSYIERCSRVLDVDNCEVQMKADVGIGSILLGPSVYGSDINISQNQTSDASFYKGVHVCDNGIGNKILINSSLSTASTRIYNGLEWDGKEWLRAGLVNDNPVFLSGISDWITSDVTSSVRNFSIKGFKRGRSMSLIATDIDGYAEHTQSVDASKEHCITIGLNFKDNIDVKVQFFDSTNTLIHDSGIITVQDFVGRNGHNLKQYRKWIPAQAGGEIKTRVVIVNSGEEIMVSDFLINESEITSDDIINEDDTNEGDPGFEEAELTFVKSLSTSSDWLRINNSDSDPDYKYIIRFKINTDGACFWGVWNDFNSDDSSNHYILNVGDNEYVMLINNPASRYEFYRFGTSINIEVSDISVHKVYDDPSYGGGIFDGTVTHNNEVVHNSIVKNMNHTLINNSSKYLNDIGITGSTAIPFTVKLEDSFCAAVLKIYTYVNGGTYNESTVFIRRVGSGISNIETAIYEVVDTAGLTLTLTKVDEETVDVEFDIGGSNKNAYMFYNVITLDGACLEVN